MAFQLPALPNFQTNIPQVDPTQQLTRLAGLRALLSENQLRQQLAPLQVQEATQRAKQAGIQTELSQAELSSQQAMIKAWSDPDFTKKITGDDTNAESSGIGFDPDVMTKELISRGVLPNAALATTQEFVKRSQTIAETQKAVAQTGEAQAGVRQKTLKQVGDALGAIQDKPVSKAQDALDAFKQRLVRDPKAFPGLTQDEKAHLYAMDLAHLGAAGGMLELEAQINDYHKGRAEQLKAEQGVIPTGAAVSPEAQQQIQKDIAVATNPQIQKGKEQVAAAEGAARANIEAQVARGGQAALANVPTHLVAPATEAATKAGTEYAQAKSVSDRLNMIMQAAKKGNVVSYQILPEEGALQITTSQGVHRINFAEIQNYGGGSLLQRLQGHLGKALTGKSIPDSVLNDMAEIQDIMAKGAKSKYENSLATINQTYGASFKPVEMKAPPTDDAAVAALLKKYPPKKIQ